MDFQTYSSQAMRTCNQELNWEQLLVNAALGLMAEGGEVGDLVKKNQFHGHQLDIEKIKDELSDCLWYVNLMCFVIGVDLEDVAKHNITKLSKRYPDKFSAEASKNREEFKELSKNKGYEHATIKTDIIV